MSAAKTNQRNKSYRQEEWTQAFRDEILNSVESGEYYNEAWRWYSYRYIHPFSQRTFYIFITLFGFLISVVAFSTVRDFYPLKIQVPLAVGVSDVSNEYPKIIPLRLHEDEDGNIAVHRYFVKHFVKIWESYDYNQIESLKNQVKNLAAPQIVAVYESRMDYRNVRNPGPILRYRDHTRRSIEITDYRLDDRTLEYDGDDHLVFHAEQPLRAYVKFRAFEENELGVQPSDWTAEVVFTMSPITFDKEKRSFNKPDFIVQAYRVAPAAKTTP